MSTNIEVRHLRAFAVTAEQLHFTRAAACLHMTQQALSTQIRLLEKQLGLKLFERTTRRVELTTAGIVLYRHVQGLIERLDCAVDEARRSALMEANVRVPLNTHRRPGTVPRRFPVAPPTADPREALQTRTVFAPASAQHPGQTTHYSRA